jgi:predicted ArsR family transcriptional regulator
LVRAELYNLENLGWVRQYEVETSSKGGRPSESWELHPEAELYFGEYYS